MMDLGASLKKIYLVLLAALWAALVCVSPAQSPSAPAPAEIKSAPPTPIAEQKSATGDSETWQPEWDKVVEEALPADLLSPQREHAVKALCPRFKSLADVDKRAFWAYFFQALAAAEAGLKPTANVRHTDPAVAVVDTVTKRTVRQEGLLQLTYMDSDRYGCDFNWQADKALPEHDPSRTILEPKNNLLCGIRILDNQLTTLHKPLLTKSSYWVTLRPGTYSYLLFMKQMKNVPEACGPTPIRHGWFSRNALPPAAEAESAPAKPGPATTPAAIVTTTTRPAALQQSGTASQTGDANASGTH